MPCHSLYPVAFFLAAIYTVSTCMLLALLAFRGVRCGQLPAAAIAALLAGLTRAPAAEIGAERPWLARVWLATSTALPLLNSALFVNWHFVS